MKSKMNASETESVRSSPPGLLASLLAGFDAVTTHIGLILFPLVLDVLIWLGPHLKASQLLILLGDSSPELKQWLQANQVWQDFAQRFNALTALRSFPVGIPSLMSGSLPILVPNGIQPLDWEVGSFASLFLLWLLLGVIGLVVGTIYYSSVSHAAISRPAHRKQILSDWPRATWQVLLLALMWLAILALSIVPISCILPIMVLISPGVAQVGVFLYAAGLIWLLFPLIFSAHGIFVNRDTAFVSLKKSIRLTRMTLPVTGSFLLVILLLSQGMNLLWSTPTENSWFLLLGIAGHAFITTGLLSASFVYYRDVDQWIKKMLLQLAT